MEPSTAADPALFHFAGILLAAALGVLQGRAERTGAFLQILVRLPGTLLHEVAHLLVAFVTGGRPTGFSIIPRCCAGTTDRSRRRVWVLGSVTIGNPSVVAALPSAMAPLLLLPFAWFLYQNWFAWFPPDLLHTLLMYAAVVLCCGSSLPSSQDVLVALSRPLGVALYALLGVGGWLMWKNF